jgi:hypothetical protein
MKAKAFEGMRREEIGFAVTSGRVGTYTTRAKKRRMKCLRGVLNFLSSLERI